VKIKELLQAETAIAKITGIEDGGIALKFLSVDRKIKALIEDFNNLRDAKIKELEPETMVIQQADPRMPEFVKYMNEAGEAEIEVTWQPVSITAVKKCDLSARMLNTLIDIQVLKEEEIQEIEPKLKK